MLPKHATVVETDAHPLHGMQVVTMYSKREQHYRDISISFSIDVDPAEILQRADCFYSSKAAI